MAMNRETRNSAIAAAIIMIGFGLLFYFMPTIMVAVGNFSPFAAALLAVGVMAAFFLVFWLRTKSRRKS